MVSRDSSAYHFELLASDQRIRETYRFKLHLKPRSSVDDSDSNVTKRIPFLPANKSAEDVLSDFLEYLFRCAKDYIIQTIPDRSFWASVEDRIDFVLTHPNGWEGSQQYSMRRAAIRAGLIPDTREARSRLTFVTEGEACLHFCVHNHLPVSVSDQLSCMRPRSMLIETLLYITTGV